VQGTNAFFSKIKRKHRCKGHVGSVLEPSSHRELRTELVACSEIPQQKSLLCARYFEWAYWASSATSSNLLRPLWRKTLHW